MTISSQNRKAGPFTGNGVTTAFPFSFKVFTASDLLVVRANLTGIETTLVLGTDYAVTLNADQNSNPGGSVTLTGALTSGFLLSITSRVPLTQSTELTNQGGFYPAVINASLDKLTILTQQLNEQVSRAPKVPITSSADASELATNIDLVADSLPAVTTVANNIAAVNTVAGISSNVTTVAGNNANVTTVATNIAAVNTNAINIVAIQNATSNALAAASSASSAAASAAAAASSFDSFDDRYLGPKASDPTLDNDSNPLVTGALYYNTTAQTMKVYDSAVWLAATSAAQASVTTYEYVATAGQTTFSGADANALTLSYIPGGLIVSRNGLILRPGDEYTASNGTSIVLAAASALGDEINAYSFSSFNVANTYTQAQIDVALAGKQNLDSDLTDLATNGAGIGNNQYVKRDSLARVPLGTNWSVFESGGVVFFRSGTTNLAKLDASGNLTVAGNVTAFGTV